VRAPALALVLAFVAGLVLSRSAGAPAAICGAAAAALLPAAAVLARSRRLAASAIVVLAYGLLGLAAGEARSRASRESTLLTAYHQLGEKSFEAPSRIEGRLRREPELGPQMAILTVDAETIRVRRGVYAAEGGLRVRVSGEHQRRIRDLAASDRVSFWGRLQQPSSFGNDGAFDVRRYFERGRLDLTASVKSALLIEREGSAPSLEAFVSRMRTAATMRLETALDAPGQETLGVVLALITGDREMLSPELETLYRDAGIFHVMAISGAQVALVILVFYFALRRTGVSEVATLLTVLLVIPLYAAFCGSGPPVVRAALAATLVVGSRLLSLDRPHANALALAALLLLLWEPLWLEDPGFQLSFAAMAAILWLAGPLASRLRPLGFFATPLSVSIAAQAVVVPITAWHFHGLTWVAPLASLIAVPLSGALVILGIALVALSDVPVVSDLLSFTAHAGVALLTGTARVAAGLPGASLAVARPSVSWMLLYYAALGSVRHGGSRVAALGLVGVAALLAALPFGRGEIASVEGRLALTALDVGHGDAIVVSLPEGQRILVDGGGLGATPFDVGERVVLPYLLDHGGRRLDAVVLTHADYDHIGGLAAIVDSMRVSEVWESAGRWERPAYRRLRQAARGRGVAFRRLRPGQSFRWGGVLWEILAAAGTRGMETPDEENDRSIVMRLTLGESSVLMTGDAGEDLERALLQNGLPLEADVLKVAHHGSASSTSASFLDAVRPRFAILSARERLGWPLPSEAVLDRLRTRGITYGRTDLEGSITVTLDAEGNIEVETFRGTVTQRRRGAEDAEANNARE
jgi:competence protein ComEC